MTDFKKIALFLTSLLPYTAQAQHYWQQEVNTRISVTLDDEEHLLRAVIELDYKNNSPDTLDFIYFHLYPNAYQNDRTAYSRQAVENGETSFYFSHPDDRGFIDSLDFRVGQERATIVPTQDLDIIKVLLPHALPPGASASISTPFRVKIPHTFSRLGHSGQSYQISQWFPKPAVYDKEGWHPMPYLDQGEFYSEFGSYDVSITIPENYIVMATGNLVDNEQEEAWLDSLAHLPLPSDTLYLKHSPASSPNFKTLRFFEENIHDFAWFADKRWVVRQEVFTLPSGKEVKAYSCYFPKHQRGWSGSLDDIRMAIMGYSKEIGDYPYQSVKAVEGALSAGGGMEYPTITVIAATNNPRFVNTVIIHEVGHNWFYGVLGSNERRYPWLDEGINSFYENKLTWEDNSFKRFTSGKPVNYLVYAMMSATRGLMPANLRSESYKNLNYGVDLYMKVPYFLTWLEDYMGKDTFKMAMQDYFETWKFKHPQAQDFEQILRKHSSKDINWFFQAIGDDRPVDFSLQKINSGTDGLRLRVKNKTGMEAPVKIRLKGTDESQDPTTAFLWTEPFSKAATIKIQQDRGFTWEEAEIDEVVPDYRPNNNSTRKSLRPALIAGTNLSQSQKFWSAPAVGYNLNDGFMAGLLVHNITVPENRLQFALAPLWGFKSARPAGTGIIGRTTYFDQGFLKDLKLVLEMKSFDYRQSKLNSAQAVSARFIKVAPEAIFDVRKPYARSTVNRSFGVKAYWIREEQLRFFQNPSDDKYYPQNGTYADHFYGRLYFQHRNETTFNPYGYRLTIETGSGFSKLSAEAQFKVDYHLKGKAFNARFYAGKLFAYSPAPLDRRHFLSTTSTAEQDYLYDETYIVREGSSGSFFENQVSIREGGFKVNTSKYIQPLGLSDNVLFAANFSTDIPYQPLPIRFFADVSTFSGAKKSNPSGSPLLYAAGIEVYLKNICSIYFPLILNKDLDDYSKSVLGNARFAKMIGFSLNLNQVNWLKLPQQMLPQ